MAAAKTHAVRSASGWGRRRLLRDLEVLHVHVDVVRDADAGKAVERLELAVPDEVRLLERRDAGAVDTAVDGVALDAHRDRLRDSLALAGGLVCGVAGRGTAAL